MKIRNARKKKKTKKGVLYPSGKKGFNQKSQLLPECTVESAKN